jgi:hypothetical protein
MSKQFALDQRAWNGSAIKSHKTVVPPMAILVNRFRDYFFAGSRFASNHNGAVHCCNHRYLVEHSPKFWAASNQIRNSHTLAP